ncbi:MAG: UDP-N-acetylglucosamine pyrophosphorylase, partial [Oscillospiraceae bacterium]|nr:UDP-N-acetylglucosamine pyrophosphorylase [Oscillospiraceae bacterium]
MDKRVKTAELFECETAYLKPLFESCEYPWELLDKIGELAEKLVADGMPGYRLLAEDVLIGEDVTIAPTATIIGPSVIGRGTEIRPGAYIRGNVITGERCVIGNSSELKNCVLLNDVQAPHYNYIGDSVLGNHAHLGAGAVCSNLKADGKNVVIRGDRDYKTERRKVGAILGDGADIGCNSVI